MLVLITASCTCISWGLQFASDGAKRQADALYRSGTEAFQAGDLHRAHTAFAGLVQMTPWAWTAHAAYGTVLLAEGDGAAAAEQLQQSLKLQPGEAQTLVNLAMAKHLLGHDREAVADFQAADHSVHGPSRTGSQTSAYAAATYATGDRSGAEKLLQEALAVAADAISRAALLDTLGMMQAQSNQMVEAQTSFEQAVAADGGMAAAHAHLGSAALALSNPQGAVPELQAAIRLGDRNATTFVQLGRAQFALADYKSAIASEKRALQQVPTLFEAQYALALALQAAERTEEAIPLFAQAEKARPLDTGVLTNYGLALVQKGDARGAIALYRRALAAGNPSRTLYENMGVAYLQSNDIEHAMEQFQAGLKIDPNSVQLHYDLGLAYKLKDDVPAAIAELRHAEELDPQLPDPPYTLGVLEMQGGDFAASSRHLERAVSLQPENGEAWSLLGSVYKQAGDPTKAEFALRQGITLLPAQPSPHVTLAAILAESGDLAGAAEERKIAAELSRVAVGHQRAEFSLNSGRALLGQGKVDDALVQFRAAVNAEPNSPATHAALADALARAGKSAEALVERDRVGLLSTPGPQAKP